MKPVDNSGSLLNANFSVTGEWPAFEVTFESGDGKGRNSDYAAGVELVLSRLAGRGARLEGGHVSSAYAVRRAAREGLDTRLRPDPFVLPLLLDFAVDFVALRKAIGRAGALVGKPEVGSGNATKRISLEIRLTSGGQILAESLEAMLGMSAASWEPSGNDHAEAIAGANPGVGDIFDALPIPISTADPSIETRRVTIRRSPEMYVVGYGLARCGTTPPDGGLSLPPAWLGVRGWKAAYDLFFPALGDGRSLRTFENSLKNARDSFDAYLDNNRQGWVQSSRSSSPQGENRMVQTILAQWSDRSDAEIREALEQIIEGAWEASDSEDVATVRTEGGQAVYIAKRYERDLRLKRDAIAIHGRTCMGCGFNFDEKYGALAGGYVEVHHCLPLADFGVRETDPARDLAVLCANCHRMVHRRRGICLAIDELRAITGYRPPH